MAGQWLWSPDLGRYSLSAHGLPEVPVYFEITADIVPDRSRYDYWRSIAYYSFEADPLPAGSAGCFNAQARCLIGRKTQLFAYKSAPVSGRGIPAAFADDRESYLIGLVVSGYRHYAEDNASVASSTPGQFFVFDNRGYSRVSWSNHSAIHISLPRSELERLLGGRIPPPDVMCRALEASRMAPALKSLMQFTAGQMAQGNDAERAFMLSQITQMAFFTCETATAELHDDKGAARSNLMTAAIQLIEQNLANPGLSVAQLQAKLGCSRATLYRAFAQADAGVSDVISDMRIQRAKAMLAGSPELPVGMVAVRCGWYDSASFARAFRRREGMSPSEYREGLRGTSGSAGRGETIRQHP
jgi:AraC family transcriptional activator of tynA and feaB